MDANLERRFGRNRLLIEEDGGARPAMPRGNIYVLLKKEGEGSRRDAPSPLQQLEQWLRERDPNFSLILIGDKPEQFPLYAVSSTREVIRYLDTPQNRPSCISEVSHGDSQFLG